MEAILVIVLVLVILGTLPVFPHSRSWGTTPAVVSALSSPSSWSFFSSVSSKLKLENTPMLHYAVSFLVIALVAAILGFGSLAGLAAEAAKILFVVFLVLFVLSLFFRGRTPRD